EGEAAKHWSTAKDGSVLSVDIAELALQDGDYRAHVYTTVKGRRSRVTTRSLRARSADNARPVDSKSVLAHPLGPHRQLGAVTAISHELGADSPVVLRGGLLEGMLPKGSEAFAGADVPKAVGTNSYDPDQELDPPASIEANDNTAFAC